MKKLFPNKRLVVVFILIIFIVACIIVASNIKIQRTLVIMSLGIDRKEAMSSYINSETYCLIDKDCSIVNNSSCGCGRSINIFHRSSQDSNQLSALTKEGFCNVYCGDTPRKAKCEDFKCVSN